MEEWQAALAAMMKDPEKMRMIQDMAANLGLSDMLAGDGNPAPAQPPPAAQAPPANMPDLSALLGLLGGASAPAPQPQTPSANMPDLSALLGLLGNQNGASSTPALPSPLAQQNASANIPDLSALLGLLDSEKNNSASPAPASSSAISALTQMLGGAQNASGSGSPAPLVDMNTILKLGKAMSNMQTNRQNIDLLLSLKPRLGSHRAKKIDDAIRIMQLVQFLPLIKESGLFQDLDGILGGLTGQGGLSSLLSSLGTGRSGGTFPGNILGQLLGR